MLHPTRFVFERNQRTAQLDLTNSGSEVSTFRISLENKRMTETGQLVVVTSPLPGELFADKIIQFSPRQVVLPPGSGQTVRIVLRKPANLAPGEYRSHLVFTRLPDARSTSVEKSDALAEKEIGIQIIPLVGASIPIIVEHGNTLATSTLSNLKLTKEKPTEPYVLELNINRSGSRSLYGNIVVHFTPNGKSEEELAKVNGIAVYAPNQMRKIRLELHSKSLKVLARGKLKVGYWEISKSGKKLLSEATLGLP